MVKADGLADGKGVIICDDTDQAQAALHKIMIEQVFGAAGKKVVIEERLEGPEISILAWSDGQTVVPTISARDHKRLFDGDQGPNTGRMGAYAPAPDISAEQIERIYCNVLEPTIKGMAAQNTPYIGVLYAGLMLTQAGPKVLEFNCRLGDPEAQVVLPLLKTDLFQILLACVEGHLDQLDICRRTETCAAIVLTSPGYPGQHPTGLPISGLNQVAVLDNIEVFHAGTRRIKKDFVTAGGRVLAISAVGHDLSTALEQHLSPELSQGLIHGDLFFDNVLVKENELRAIIDFEESCHYYKAFDLGMGILGLCTEKRTVALDKIVDLATALRAEILTAEASGAKANLNEHALPFIITPGADIVHRAYYNSKRALG